MLVKLQSTKRVKEARLKKLAGKFTWQFLSKSYIVPLYLERATQGEDFRAIISKFACLDKAINIGQPVRVLFPNSA